VAALTFEILSEDMRVYRMRWPNRLQLQTTQTSLLRQMHLTQPSCTTVYLIAASYEAKTELWTKGVVLRDNAGVSIGQIADTFEAMMQQGDEERDKALEGQFPNLNVIIRMGGRKP